MIIRATLHDSNLTKYLIEFFESFNENISKDIQKLSNVRIESLSKEDLNKYSRQIKKEIIDYFKEKKDLVNEDDFKKIKRNLLVALRRRLDPHDEDKKTLYYIMLANNYIVL